MKEQILHLDPHDDYHSARDKMGWTQTQRVLLVWPKHGRVPLRRLDLLLLHRHAHRLGAHLGLVTHDSEVREHARSLGLPVFASIEASRQMRWRSRPVRMRPERLHPTPRVSVAALKPTPLQLPPAPPWVVWVFKSLVFVLGLGALALLAYALIPSATVTLAPAIHPLQTTVEIVADPNLPQVESGGLIPARTVQVEIGPRPGITPTTGLKDVPSAPAVGTVVFTNLVGTQATIPQGTGVRTTGGLAVRFTTTRTVAIEGRIGATAEVGIEAADPGPSGNVGAGKINAIDGPLGLQLAVTNPAPTTGGAVAQEFVVTSADRESLRAHLLAQLNEQAGETIVAQLQPGEFLVPDSITTTEIIFESYEQAVGEEADAVQLTLRIAVSGLAVNENDARLAAQQALAAQVPPDGVLIPDQTRFERNPITAIGPDGLVRFTVTASGASAPRLDPESIRQMIKGQPIPQAHDHLLNALPIAGPPQIVVSPAWYARWFNRLPWLPFRTVVRTEGGG